MWNFSKIICHYQLTPHYLLFFSRWVKKICPILCPHHSLTGWQSCRRRSESPWSLAAGCCRMTGRRRSTTCLWWRTTLVTPTSLGSGGLTRVSRDFFISPPPPPISPILSKTFFTKPVPTRSFNWNSEFLAVYGNGGRVKGMHVVKWRMRRGSCIFPVPLLLATRTLHCRLPDAERRWLRPSVVWARATIEVEKKKWLLNFYFSFTSVKLWCAHYKVWSSSSSLRIIHF